MHTSFIPATTVAPPTNEEQELQALIEEARRRARRRRFGYSALVAALVAAGGLYLAFGGDGNQPPVEGPPVQPDGPSLAAAHGVQVQLEPGWRMAETSLTPKLVSPTERLSVGTFAMRPGGSCSQLPSQAYDDMGRRDAIITIMERGSRHTGYPQRPAAFDLHTRPAAFECAPVGLDSHEFVFRDSGRNFYAFVVVGPQGPTRDAEAILNSFDATQGVG